jgi:hypothetical protein
MRRVGPQLKTLVALGLVGIFTFNIAVTGMFTFISTLNYPGGHALSALHTVLQDSRQPGAFPAWMLRIIAH